MRNILLVLKNNLYRLSKEKLTLFMIFIMTPVVVYFGVFFSNSEIKGSIAVVGASSIEESSLKEAMGSNENISLKFLKESPSKTDLIKGIYLSSVDFTGDEVTVESFGNEEVRKSIEAGIKGEVYTNKEDTTTVQGKIIGFLIMFLFFGGIMVMEFFLNDREDGTYSRVLLGDISYYEYILGQLLYSICILTTPTIILSILVLKFLAVELTISLGLFALLILLIGLLGTSFSILVCTFCKGVAVAQMTMSTITMIVCLLGGCLINIVDNNKVIGWIRNLLPPKRLIDLSNNYNNEDLIFLVVVIVVFLLISIFYGKKQCDRGEFV